MDKDIYQFIGYKDYLKYVLKRKPGNGHGFRSKIAKAIDCRVAYVSQVLNGDANFSLEQAEGLNQFLGHTFDEGEFLLLLILFERAGSATLKKRYKIQIENFFFF